MARLVGIHTNATHSCCVGQFLLAMAFPDESHNLEHHHAGASARRHQGLADGQTATAVGISDGREGRACRPPADYFFAQVEMPNGR